MNHGANERYGRLVGDHLSTEVGFSTAKSRVCVLRQQIG